MTDGFSFPVPVPGDLVSPDVFVKTEPENMADEWQQRLDKQREQELRLNTATVAKGFSDDFDTYMDQVVRLYEFVMVGPVAGNDD